jgi:hypothetical protein
MRRHTTDNSEKGQSLRDQQRIVTALQTLLDLLENYAPAWYTQEHHDLASEALAIASGRRSRSSVKHSVQGHRAPKSKRIA